MLTHLAPARRRLVIGVLVLVVVAVLAGVATAVVSRRGEAPVDQAQPGPVVLVPGYGGSLTSLTPLATALRAAGRDVTVVSLPDRAEGDLEQQATVVGSTVDATLARTGARSVDLVGYSAGGVVARLWVTEDGGSSRVRRLVTLGSPHAGTEVAAVGTLVAGTCPTACQQLAPDSAVLSSLAREAVPTGLVFLSLWSTSDDVVLPPTSSVVPGIPSPSLQSICPTSTVRHSGLPGDVLVQHLVAAALGTGALPTWTTADCARLSS